MNNVRVAWPADSLSTHLNSFITKLFQFHGICVEPELGELAACVCLFRKAKMRVCHVIEQFEIAFLKNKSSDNNNNNRTHSARPP